MWFQYQSYKDRSPLKAFIGLQGIIYFTLLDIGKFLNFANIYGFAKRNGKRFILEALPKDPLFSYPKSQNCYVVTFEEMLHILESKRSRFNDIQNFIEKWNFGRISKFSTSQNPFLIMTPQYLYLAPKAAYCCKIGFQYIKMIY